MTGAGRRPCADRQRSDPVPMAEADLVTCDQTATRLPPGVSNVASGSDTDLPIASLSVAECLPA